MRKILSLSLVGAVAVALTTVVAPVAKGAGSRIETEEFHGLADAKALDLHVLGRHLLFGLASAESQGNLGTRALTLEASGVGTLLSPRTSVRATTGGENPSDGGRACHEVPLADLLGEHGLPTLILAEVACGEASTRGDLSSFEATGIGQVAGMRLRATEILKPALERLRPVLDPMGGTTIDQLLTGADAPSKQAVATLNDLFGTLLGSGVAVLPTLEPSQTVNDLLHHLQDSDLLRVDLGNAVAKNSGNRTAFISESIAQGGTLEVLPAFRGAGLPPLLKITTGESAASVTYDGQKTTGVGSARNTLVRIESELLPILDVGQVGVAGLRSLDALTRAAGLKSGPGFIELAPGQNVTLFCDSMLGVLAALCTEISVGQPKETELPDGDLRIESAAVTIHLFKGLDNLVPGVKLGTALGDADLERLAAPMTDLTGLNLGERSDVTGIKLALAQASARAGRTGVLERGDAATAPAAPAAAPAGPAIDTIRTLPRTGGLPPATAMIPVLLGASAALRSVIRRSHSP